MSDDRGPGTIPGEPADPRPVGASVFTPDAEGRRAFAEYIDRFNAGELDRFTEFYADDIEMVLPSATLRGKGDIRGFYTTMWSSAREILTVHDVILDEGGLAIDVTSRFAALRDAPDLVVGPLAAGEYYEARYFIHYRLRNGKVARIEAARKAPMTGPHQLSDEERAALAR